MKILSTILLSLLLLDSRVVTGKHIHVAPLAVFETIQYILESEEYNCRIDRENYEKVEIGQSFDCFWRRSFKP